MIGWFSVIALRKEKLEVVGHSFHFVGILIEDTTVGAVQADGVGSAAPPVAAAGVGGAIQRARPIVKDVSVSGKTTKDIRRSQVQAVNWLRGRRRAHEGKST